MESNNNIDYTELYIRIHGMNDLIPTKWFSSKKYRSIDDVYKDAVLKNKTWRELTGWNDDKKSKILL